MRGLALLLALAAAGAGAQTAAPEPLDRTPIEATTAAGERVRLFPNGRWEYADKARAEAAKKVAEQYPENKVRPAEAQGGLFGLGRTVMPGDKDYNRGSLGRR